MGWEEKGEHRARLLGGGKAGSPGQTFALSLWQRLKPSQESSWFLGGRKGAWLWKNTLYFTDIFTALKHFVNLQ